MLNSGTSGNEWLASRAHNPVSLFKTIQILIFGCVKGEITLGTKGKTSLLESTKVPQESLGNLFQGLTLWIEKKLVQAETRKAIATVCGLKTFGTIRFQASPGRLQFGVAASLLFH